MIVRGMAGELWLFDQRDHSGLCGEMARRWGAPPFRAVPPDVQLAAEIHDGGWPEWDARPRLDPATGRPHPYSSMPDDDYHAIWERGLARGWAAGECAGLLVSLHALRFFERRRRPEDRALVRTERERHATALRRLGAPGGTPGGAAGGLPEPFATWHAWMFFWDGLSLFLCENWRSPWTHAVPADTGEVVLRAERSGAFDDTQRIRIEPYPFTAALRLQVSARVIPDRGYAVQAELDEALAGATRRSLAWTLTPEVRDGG